MLSCASVRGEKRWYAQFASQDVHPIGLGGFFGFIVEEPGWLYGIVGYISRYWCERGGWGGDLCRRPRRREVGTPGGKAELRLSPLSSFKELQFDMLARFW